MVDKEKVEKIKALDRAEAWDKEKARREAREKDRLNREENDRLILLKATERQVGKKRPMYLDKREIEVRQAIHVCTGNEQSLSPQSRLCVAADHPQNTQGNVPPQDCQQPSCAPAAAAAALLLQHRSGSDTTFPTPIFVWSFACPS